MKQSLTEQLGEATDIHFSKTLETDSNLFLMDQQSYQYKFDKHEENLFIRISGRWDFYAELETVKIKSFREKIFLSMKHIGKVGRKKFFEKVPFIKLKK